MSRRCARKPRIARSKGDEATSTFLAVLGRWARFAPSSALRATSARKISTRNIPMASIQKNIIIDARPEDVWDALARFRRAAYAAGAGLRDRHKTRRRCAHRHLCQRHGGARSACRQRRRASGGWSMPIKSERLTQHSASAQVFAESDGRSRLVWIVDVLPNEVAPYMDAPDGPGRGCDAEGAFAQGRLTLRDLTWRGWPLHPRQCFSTSRCDERSSV